jgi:CheY-like chemotaxis protein
VDVQMPGMNGFELAELMRGTERTRRIPIIFVSAAGRELNYAFRAMKRRGRLPAQAAGPARGGQQGQRVRRPVPAPQARCGTKWTLSQPRTASRKRWCSSCSTRSANWNARCACATTSCRWCARAAHAAQHALPGGAAAQLHLSKGNLAIFAADRLPAMIERDQRQIRNMVRLIDDMLDVTRMRSDALSIRTKPVDLAALRARWSRPAAAGRGRGLGHHAASAARCAACGTSSASNRCWSTC